MSILFSKLTELFPKDTMWIDGCAEIIGYSPKENLHIVIDDGQCKSDNGMYMVHKYHPLDQRMHMLDWNSGKYPLKYLSKNAKKVFEGWVNFSDSLEVKEVDLMMHTIIAEGCDWLAMNTNLSHDEIEGCRNLMLTVKEEQLKA